MSKTKKSYQIHQVKQRSPEWYELREGKITSSIAKSAKSGESTIFETLAVMLTGKKERQFTNEYMDRGTSLEGEAIKEFERVTGLKVELVGFVSNGYLGWSPDGVIFKGDKIVGGIEVKCPDTKNHIKNIVSEKFYQEHQDQLIHGFVVVDDLETNYFVSYDPRLLQRKIYIKEVQRSSQGANIEVAKVAYQTFMDKLLEYKKKIVL